MIRSFLLLSILFLTAPAYANDSVQIHLIDCEVKVEGTFAKGTIYSNYEGTMGTIVASDKLWSNIPMKVIDGDGHFYLEATFDHDGYSGTLEVTIIEDINRASVKMNVGAGLKTYPVTCTRN